MGFRTNPDRILENIDRARERAEDAPRSGTNRQATGRELDTGVPDSDATNPERVKRIFKAVERAYTSCAQSAELGPVASRFQTIGDLRSHRARGDVSVSIQYLDADRSDDIGLAPFEIRPEEIEEARKETKTSRPDVNAMKVLRGKLRTGVLAAYRKIEPRIREALRERADVGHVSVQVTVDLRAVD
ncbi:MAG TPA: hypothetical protein VE173_02310 [Longimicrobiales bacterium]|nr:hypothetical protein [Longimicrobiales bacterium]